MTQPLPHEPVSYYKLRLRMSLPYTRISSILAYGRNSCSRASPSPSSRARFPSLSREPAPPLRWPAVKLEPHAQVLGARSARSPRLKLGRRPRVRLEVPADELPLLESDVSFPLSRAGTAVAVTGSKSVSLMLSSLFLMDWTSMRAGTVMSTETSTWSSFCTLSPPQTWTSPSCPAGSTCRRDPPNRERGFLPSLENRDRRRGGRDFMIINPDSPLTPTLRLHWI